MADDITKEPAESTSQEFRGIVDTGEESFAVDGISEVAETKGDETPAENEKPGKEPPIEEKPEEKAGKKPEEKAEEKSEEEVEEKSEKKPEEKLPTEPSDEDIPAGVKKRLATITRKRREAERASATLQTQNQELLFRIEALEHPGEKSGKEPQIDEYETEEEYLEAVSDYKADQKIAEREAEAKIKAEGEIREGQEAEAQARQGALMERLQKGVEKYDDFEDVIEDLNITGDMINILESFPNIPDVVYALGNDPEIVAKLVEMPFLQAAYVMKEISDGLTKKKNTKATDAIKPVSTSGGAIKSLEKMSQAEYNAARDKQDAERKGMHY